MESGSSSSDEIRHRVTHLGCGSSHTICRLDTGLILSWGLKSIFQDLRNKPEERAVPCVVSHLTDKHISLITSGEEHCIAISEEKKQLYSWEWNDHDCDEHGNMIPRHVSELAGVTVLQVACGHRHALLLADGGALFSFGSNNAGQLGHGHCGRKVSRPGKLRTQGIPKEYVVTSVAAGAEHSLVSTDVGIAYAWGRGNDGRLGNVTTDEHLYPRQVAGLAFVRVKSVCCGRAHSTAIDGKGGVYTFGSNSHGQLGHGDCKNRDCATRIELLSKITKLACGWNYTVAADGDGNFYAWGDNEFGQLGTGDRLEALSPHSIHLQGKEGKNVVIVSCGQYHTIVATDKAEVYSWGRGAEGQLGHGDLLDSDSPKRLEKLSHPNLRPDEFVDRAKPPQSDNRAVGCSANASDVPVKTRAGTAEKPEEPQTKKYRTE